MDEIFNVHSNEPAKGSSSDTDRSKLGIVPLLTETKFDSSDFAHSFQHTAYIQRTFY